MEDEATPKLTVLLVIPEVYYDLISRVPPGVLVVASLYLLYVPVSRRFNLEGITVSCATLVLAGLLGSGYAVGLLISSLGDNIRQMHRRNDWDVISRKYSHLCPAMIRKFRPATKELSAVDAQKIIFAEHRQIYRELHEFLKHTDPQARFVLPKMNAESSLCSNLVIAFIVILPPLVLRQGWFSVPVIWSCLAMAICLYASFYRTRRSIERHFTFFALVALDLKKSLSASA